MTREQHTWHDRHTSAQGCANRSSPEGLKSRALRHASSRRSTPPESNGDDGTHQRHLSRIRATSPNTLVGKSNETLHPEPTRSNGGRQLDAQAVSAFSIVYKSRRDSSPSNPHRYGMESTVRKKLQAKQQDIQNKRAWNSERSSSGTET